MIISFLIVTTIIAFLLWIYARNSFKRNILEVFHLNLKVIYFFDFLFITLIWSRLAFKYFTNLHDNSFFLMYLNFSYVMLGLAGLIIILMFMLDVLNFLDKKTLAKTNVTSERRAFLKKSLAIGGLSSSAVITGVGYQNSFNPILNKVEIKLPDQFKYLAGLKIAQISDVHIGPTLKKEFAMEVVSRVNKLDADLVVVTGDLIDGNVEDLFHDVLPLKNLKGKLGVFYSSGNHEYYWKPEEWFQFIDKELGFKILHNSNAKLVFNGKEFAICGVSDMYGARYAPDHAPDYKKAAANLNQDIYKVLLAHQPKSCFNAVKEGFHLQISGHTHGGQGFPWNILVRMAQPYIKGVYNHEGMNVFVHAGTGFWGPPNRFMVNSEIALIELV